MKNTLYLYSHNFLFKIIKEILFEYKVIPLTIDQINSNNFKNNNTLLVLKKNNINEIKKSFFFNNNVVVFFPNKQDLSNITNVDNVKFFYGRSNVKKFVDEIKTSFISKTLVLKNIEIVNEKISNINSGDSLLLTTLEKEILVVLIENKKIKRDYLLEEILKIKKNIETKTIESHLSRIRKKLINIKSDIQIKVKRRFFLFRCLVKIRVYHRKKIFLKKF